MDYGKAESESNKDPGTSIVEAGGPLDGTIITPFTDEAGVLIAVMRSKSLLMWRGA
jgi:hypothetical protein